ncbi:MAG: NrfD/PsrC family molybdoenzyme membrane anchor subunit [Armatimonadota bacterium]|nr:NrfD/PsrC family molybdoenzyme membrane anchor subunit [Armatimonadota bacterium]MDR7485494.1 NrfD/PsrC family molybdoenzyme membrane anchor subunit [Armatimonadota bacterium]MDR7533039.1 NrfD/PsrC family molybdoenzyme membrane anchor subunit [Armatimonadota bacterium]MDR7536789.1 NrfD/PsrC family molybdoenzyme membrane anchor subunit [Armatimonadota bacterium]
MIGPAVVAVTAFTAGSVAAVPTPVVERVDAVLNPRLHLWGWEVATYLFLGGVAAGLLIFASWAHLAGRRRQFLPAVRVASLLVPPLIVAGLVLLWLDLGSRWTPFWLYVTLRPTSPMSWGAWILLAVLLTSSLAAVPALLATGVRSGLCRRWPWLHRMPEQTGRWAGRRGRALAWTNLALGIGLGLYTGILLGTMVARPVWNSPVLGPLFLASGLSAAGAVLMLLVPRGPWVPLLVRAEAGLHVSKLALVGLYLAGLATAGTGPQAAAAMLVRGSWAVPFWTLVVGAGMLVPLGAALREVVVHRCPRPLAVASCALTLAGGLALRVVLVYAGQRGL